MTTTPSPPTTTKRRSKFRLNPPVVREHSLQEQIARVLSIEIAPPGKVSAHGVVWYSIDHANYAGQVPGIRIARGIVAGVPDVFVLFLGRAHMIELKATDGVMSDAQTSVASAILAGGGRFAVVTTAEQILAALDEWNVPRHGRIRIVG